MNKIVNFGVVSPVAIYDNSTFVRHCANIYYVRDPDGLFSLVYGGVRGVPCFRLCGKEHGPRARALASPRDKGAIGRGRPNLVALVTLVTLVTP